MDLAGLWDILSATLHSVAKSCQGDEQFREGRQYSVWHVLKMYLLSVFLRVSPNILYERIAEGKKAFRKAWKLPNRAISLSQLKKRLGTACTLRALVELLRVSAQRILKQVGEGEVQVVAADLTRIESTLRDAKAAWGFDSKGAFFGYKLGLVVSQSGIVLGMSLMKANWTEAKVRGRLLRMTRETLRMRGGTLTVHYLVCDSGFDGEPFYRAAHTILKAPQLCPPRRKRNPRVKSAKKYLARVKKHTPHRFKDQELWETLPDRKAIYRKRTVVEQVNGQLKDVLRIHEVQPRRRGVKNLLRSCLAKLVIYNFALNVNAAQNRNLRQIKRLVC
jgi:hypothetical protein